MVLKCTYCILSIWKFFRSDFFQSWSKSFSVLSIRSRWLEHLGQGLLCRNSASSTPNSQVITLLLKYSTSNLRESNIMLVTDRIQRSDSDDIFCLMMTHKRIFFHIQACDFLTMDRHDSRVWSNFWIHFTIRRLRVRNESSFLFRPEKLLTICTNIWSNGIQTFGQKGSLEKVAFKEWLGIVQEVNRKLWMTSIPDVRTF